MNTTPYPRARSIFSPHLSPWIALLVVLFLFFTPVPVALSTDHAPGAVHDETGVVHDEQGAGEAPDASAESAELAVTGFTLINAETNQPILGYDPIPDNARIDINALPTRKLNIRADVTGPVESVWFDFLNTHVTENVAPYAVFGDNNGNYNAGSIPVGPNGITAIPYSADGRRGTQGKSRSISFVLVDPQPGDDRSVISFSLIDETTNKPFAGYDPIEDGQALNGHLLPLKNLNIRANVKGLIGRVEFEFDGTYRTSESVAPYALFGDNKGDYNPGTISIGDHVVSARVYTTIGDVTYVSQPRTVHFSIDLDTAQSEHPLVSGFWLINAVTDAPIRAFVPIEDGAVIDLNQLPTDQLNIQAFTHGPVDRVRFEMNGQVSNENVAPYALFGDVNRDYNAGTLPIGTVTLSATPYGEGKAWETKTVTFTVTRGSANRLSDVSFTPYPNPFNPRTTLAFDLPESGAVRLAVYDMLGREVRVLVDGPLQSGVHEVGFEAGGLASGVYLARLVTPGSVQVRRIMLMK